MLSQQLASFLEEGLAIHLATRNARLEPSAARVAALTVDPDRRHVLAFLSEGGASAVLADLEDNGQVAIVCARPPDERGCQVKGVFSGARPATSAERAIVVAQWERFRDRLEVAGLPRVATDGWVIWPAVAIRVRVQALFDQTPGPGAGAPLA
jgi:hypothetical protein